MSLGSLFRHLECRGAAHLSRSVDGDLGRECYLCPDPPPVLILDRGINTILGSTVFNGPEHLIADYDGFIYKVPKGSKILGFSYSHVITPLSPSTRNIRFAWGLYDTLGQNVPVMGHQYSDSGNLALGSSFTLFANRVDLPDFPFLVQTYLFGAGGMVPDDPGFKSDYRWEIAVGKCRNPPRYCCLVPAPR